MIKYYVAGTLFFATLVSIGVYATETRTECQISNIVSSWTSGAQKACPSQARKKRDIDKSRV